MFQKSPPDAHSIFLKMPREDSEIKTLLEKQYSLLLENSKKNEKLFYENQDRIVYISKDHPIAYEQARNTADLLYIMKWKIGDDPSKWPQLPATYDEFLAQVESTNPYRVPLEEYRIKMDDLKMDDLKLQVTQIFESGSIKPYCPPVP